MNKRREACVIKLNYTFFRKGSSCLIFSNDKVLVSIVPDTDCHGKRNQVTRQVCGFVKKVYAQDIGFCPTFFQRRNIDLYESFFLFHQLLLYCITNYSRVIFKTRFFQNAGPVSADGLYTQHQLVGDILYRHPRCNHTHDLIFSG